MKFIHTADWQIGMAAAHVGDAADDLRRTRLESAKRVVSTARSHQVDFIVIAGDTFEHNAVSREVVAEVAQILSSADCPVFVIAGNHDPLQPGSVWESPAWHIAPNVKILTERTPLKINGGVLYPCPLFRKRSAEDPTAWIAPDGVEGVRVAIAHGTAGDLINDDGGSPISFDTPSRTQLDYIALGHWHSTMLFTTAGAVRMAYSGTHETCRFGEKDSGNVLLVEIAEPGSPPQVKKLRTGALVWEQISETITEPDKLGEIKHRLEQIEDTTHRLVELTLSGLFFESDLQAIVELRRYCERFLFSRFDDSALRPAPEDDGWFELLPGGMMREVAMRLRTLAGGPEESATIATQALRELYALHAEVHP
jgi:DNA repair exonuclease SbcCD nuclease subunit